MVKLSQSLSKNKNGFTLIEVLIALVILAIALTAVVKTTLDDTQSTAYLQNKTVAHWVGLEIISQAQLGLLALPDIGDSTDGTMTMFNQDWRWHAKFIPTPDHNVDQLNVTVSLTINNQTLALLSGYVINQPTKP